VPLAKLVCMPPKICCASEAPSGHWIWCRKRMTHMGIRNCGRALVGTGLIAASLLVSTGTVKAAGAPPSWSSPVELPLAEAGGVFAGVSCGDQLDCVAVGYEVTYPNDALTDTPIYATESNGVWSNASVFSDPRGNGSFSSVSCSDPSHCTAVGLDASGALVVTESNGVWNARSALKTTT
jgi:hypothetical protein